MVCFSGSGVGDLGENSYFVVGYSATGRVAGTYLASLASPGPLYPALPYRAVISHPVFLVRTR